jgi:C1A family cysteine protease
MQVDPNAAFLQWAKDNGKTYSSNLEESYRFLVWRNTLNDVISWNTDMAETGYFKGLTYFADQTQEEFESFLCSAAALNATASSPEFLKRATPLEDGPQDGNHTAPSSFDWRAAGVVGSVRNQQRCGGW